MDEITAPASLWLGLSFVKPGEVAAAGIDTWPDSALAWRDGHADITVARDRIIPGSSMACCSGHSTQHRFRVADDLELSTPTTVGSGPCGPGHFVNYSAGW
jgi:hypothetical protein